MPRVGEDAARFATRLSAGGHPAARPVPVDRPAGDRGVLVRHLHVLRPVSRTLPGEVGRRVQRPRRGGSRLSRRLAHPARSFGLPRRSERAGRANGAVAGVLRHGRRSLRREPGPRGKPVHAFVDGFTGLRKTAADYATLRRVRPAARVCRPGVGARPPARLREEAGHARPGGRNGPGDQGRRRLRGRDRHGRAWVAGGSRPATCATRSRRSTTMRLDAGRSTRTSATWSRFRAPPTRSWPHAEDVRPPSPRGPPRADSPPSAPGLVFAGAPAARGAVRRQGVRLLTPAGGLRQATGGSRLEALRLQVAAVGARCAPSDAEHPSVLIGRSLLDPRKHKLPLHRRMTAPATTSPGDTGGTAWPTPRRTTRPSSGLPGLQRDPAEEPLHALPGLRHQHQQGARHARRDARRTARRARPSTPS